MYLALCCVFGGDAHVLIGEIAAPGDPRAAAIPQLKPDKHRGVLEIGAGVQVLGGRWAVEGQGLAGGHQLVGTQPQGQAARVQGHPGPARGGHDAAPVGIAAMDGALDQGRAADGAGDGAGAGPIGGTLHPHLNQAGGAFAITGNGPGQVLRHRRQAGLQGIKVLGGQGLAGGKGQNAGHHLAARRPW